MQAAAWLLASVFSLPAHAGNGTTSADFLNIGVGARQAAMGEAAAGLADDVTALYWNPAGLGGLIENQAMFQHDQWFDGVTYEYGAFAHPTRSHGTFAADFAMLNYGSIPASDEFGASLGNTTASDSMAQLGWGSPLLLYDRMRLGLAAQWVHEKLDAYSASGYAFDGGALGRLYQAPDWSLQAGAGFRNAGQGLKFVSAGQPMPLAEYLGLGVKAFDESLAGDVDLTSSRSGGLYANLGLEYWLHPMVALRAGYSTYRSAGTGLDAGVGIKVGRWQFDYGFSDFGELGFAHRGGVSFRFGAPEEMLYEQGLALMKEGRHAEAVLKFNQVLQLNPRHRRALARIKEARDRLEQERESMKQP